MQIVALQRPNCTNYVINEISKKQSTLLIGIDGCGGSGKSTFADKIKEEFSNVTIVHKVDFTFLPLKL